MLRSNEVETKLPIAQVVVKAIVIHSPFAQEIASGEKDIEYRSWGSKYRGWLAIVAARQRDWGNDAGRAVCFVRLVDCREVGDKNFEWDLSNQCPLKYRLEIPGRLGLFDVTDLVPLESRLSMAAIDIAKPIVAAKKRRSKRRAAAPSDEEIIAEYTQAWKSARRAGKRKA